MKHFLTYDSDGNLGGDVSYTNAVTGHHGWPEDYDLDNPNTTSPKALNWLASLKNKPTGGFIRYDCPCPPTEHRCRCCAQCRVDKYVDTDGNLVDKPTTAVTVDGSTYVSGTLIDRPPGTDTVVAISCPDVPDGTKLTVAQQAHLNMLETHDGFVELTVADGAVPDVTLRAPAQGFVGTVGIFGKLTHRIDIKIRGWS